MAAAGGNRENAHSGPGYRAFLLRCWQEPGAGPNGEPPWRFALLQPGDEGIRRGFASLEDLVAFLRQELEGTTPPRRAKQKPFRSCLTRGGER
jgi:hypothetical protein